MSVKFHIDSLLGYTKIIKLRQKKFRGSVYMTYVHMIKPKGLHYAFIFYFDKFTIQMIIIYNDVGKIQKCKEENKIDWIIINCNQIVQSYIFSYHIPSQLYE
jgi:hypothetical protein